MLSQEEHFGKICMDCQAKHSCPTDYHPVSKFKLNAPEQTVNDEVSETNRYIAIGSSCSVP
jgi:hypothetical protein